MNTVINQILKVIGLSITFNPRVSLLALHIRESRFLDCQGSSAIKKGKEKTSHSNGTNNIVYV